MSENTAAGEGLDPQQTGGEGTQAQDAGVGLTVCGRWKRRKRRAGYAAGRRAAAVR